MIADECPPDRLGAGSPAGGLVVLPGVGGQAGQRLERDRKVVAVGGAARLAVGELLPDRQGPLARAAGAAALLGLAGQVTRRSASPAGQCQAVPFQCKISVATGGAEPPTAQAWRDGGMKQRPSREL